MSAQRYVGFSLAIFALSTMSILRGETLQSARITQIIREVKLLSGATPRPAAVSDEVSGNSAVRTGDESRAELTFGDLTITRLGANTIFSFNEGARELTLNKGAILVSVPRNSAAVKVSTAAVSAGITGGTALMNVNAGDPTKLFVLEGHGRLCSKKTGDCKTAAGGEFVMVMPDGRVTEAQEFNAKVLYETSRLIVDFGLLPNADLINAVIAQQQGGAGAYAQTWPPSAPYDYIDMLDVIDQAFAGFLPISLPTLPAISLTTVTLTGPSVNWSDPTSWKPKVVPNNNATQAFTAIIPGGTVFQDIASGVVLHRLQMSGGTLVLQNPIKLTNGFVYNGGSIGATSTLSIFGMSRQNTTLTWDGPTINNHGTYNITFDNADVFTGAGTFNNSGTFIKTTGLNEDTILVPFNNAGTVEVKSGGLVFAGGGTSNGTFLVQLGAVIDFNGSYTFTGGTQFVGRDGNINFNESANITLSGSITNGSFIHATGSVGSAVNLTLNGDTTWSGTGTLLLGGFVNVQGTGTFTNSSKIVGDTQNGTFGNGAIGIFNQAGGVIDANQNALMFNLNPSSLGLTNAGTLRASNDGILVLDGSGGGSFNNTGRIETVTGGSLQFSGPVTSSGVVDLGTTGSLNIVGSSGSTGSYTQTAGTFRMRGGTVTSITQLRFQGGTLDAHGTINAPSLQNNGTITPALGGNGLAVKANVTLLASSTLNFQLGGLTQGTQYSSMNVNGTVALNGNLVLSFANGFQNSVTGADAFTLLTSTSNFTGSFSNIASGMRLETSDNVGSFVVEYSGSTLTLSGFKPGPVIHSGPIAAAAKTRVTTIHLTNSGQLIALLDGAKPDRGGKITVARTSVHKTAVGHRSAHDARLLHSRSSLALAREGQRNR